ncbi:MAG: T9SS type A sorting domain-containing protein, partial [Saprospiraceae bacterium]
IDPDLWLLSKNNTIEQVITAVDDTNKPNSFDVFPNPAHDYVQIISGQTVFSVDVIDVTGRKFRTPLSGNRLNLTNFNPGIYTLILMDKSGKVLITKRIILS